MHEGRGGKNKNSTQTELLMGEQFENRKKTLSTMKHVNLHTLQHNNIKNMRLVTGEGVLERADVHISRPVLQLNQRQGTAPQCLLPSGGSKLRRHLGVGGGVYICV